MKLARDEMHVLTGSYALDALGPREMEAFERHLPYCEPCEAEVRGLRETATRLALAKARRPPARMQQRVLAATYRTRQLPPLPSQRPAEVRRRWSGPVLALAAASVAAVLAVGMTRLATQPRPGVSVQTARTSVGGAVTLIVTPSRQDAVLTARLPSLPDGRIYQVWVIGPAGARSAGFLSGTVLALSGVPAGERVGVTVEPAGGTLQPTTTPIVLVPVPA